MLGDMICKMRKQNEFSQSLLGEKLNLSASTIGMYEQNRRLPDVDILVDLCKIFSVSSDFLLEISDNPQPYKRSETKTSIQERINHLIKYNEIDISFVAQTTKIRSQRLNDILGKNKKPDINELIVLSECFSESTDYLLGLTDEHINGYSMNLYSSPQDAEFFPERLRLQMDDYTEMEVADTLNISISKFRKLLSGKEQPDADTLFQLAQLFKASTDYLLGLADKSRIPNAAGIVPFETDTTSLQRIQSILEDDYDEYLANELDMTQEELYNFYHYGFVPHINVIKKFCSTHHVSADYILGLSDNKLSIISTKEINEETLIESYRKLNPPYRTEIDGKVAAQILQQERDNFMRSSVAAEEPERKASGK